MLTGSSWRRVVATERWPSWHEIRPLRPFVVCSPILSRAESCRRSPEARASNCAATRNHSSRLGLRTTSRQSRAALAVCVAGFPVRRQKFPVSEFRETRRVGPRDWAGLENLVPPGSQVRVSFLHFPCRSGTSASRDGFAIDCPHRQSVRVSGEFGSGARAGGESPVISRDFGRAPGRTPTGDGQVARFNAPQR